MAQIAASDNCVIPKPPFCEQAGTPPVYLAVVATTYDPERVQDHLMMEGPIPQESLSANPEPMRRPMLCDAAGLSIDRELSPPGTPSQYFVVFQKKQKKRGVVCCQ